MKDVDGRRIWEPGDAFTYYPNGLGKNPGLKEERYGMVIDTEKGVILFGEPGAGEFIAEKSVYPDGCPSGPIQISVGAGIPVEVVYAMQTLRVLMDLPTAPRTLRSTTPQLDEAAFKAFSRVGIEIEQDYKETLLTVGPKATVVNVSTAILCACKDRTVTGHAVTQRADGMTALIRFRVT